MTHRAPAAAAPRRRQHRYDQGAGGAGAWEEEERPDDDDDDDDGQEASTRARRAFAAGVARGEARRALFGRALAGATYLGCRCGGARRRGTRDVRAECRPPNARLCLDDSEHIL